MVFKQLASPAAGREAGAAAGEARRPEPTQLRIGAKLRHARMVRRLRLRDVAEAVGCSESLVSKIETERAVPSLQLLHRLAAHLGTSIGAMFADDGPQDTPVMRAGKRPILSVDTIGRPAGRGIRLEALVPNGDLLYASIHIVDPGGDSGGEITHAGEETGYVLEGQIRIRIGAEVYDLARGDSFFFRSDVPHGYSNPGTTVARILWVNTPPTF